MSNSINYPLVSIVVITYNSEKYVLETLESAKAQTYRNLELIISDDCSTDGTAEVCRNWLENNQHFFINSKLIKASKNTGIPSNVNRGVNAARGKWIKLIAGDDILLDNCISDNIDYVKDNHNINFLFSKPIYINENSNTITSNDSKKIRDNDPFYRLSAKKQYLHLLTKNHPINPPTLFYKKKIVDDLGGFDENFVNEDFPLYLKITKAGNKLYFKSKETIKYRIHSSSISQKIKGDKAISDWNLKKLKFTVIPQINKYLFLKHPLIVIDIYNKLLFYKLVILFGNTKKVNNNLSFIRWLSPLLILNKLKNWN